MASRLCCSMHYHGYRGNEDKLIGPICFITMSNVIIPPMLDMNVAISKLKALLKKAGLTSAPHSLHFLGLVDFILSHAENVSFLQFGHILFLFSITFVVSNSFAVGETIALLVLVIDRVIHIGLTTF